MPTTCPACLPLHALHIYKKHKKTAWLVTMVTESSHGLITKTSAWPKAWHLEVLDSIYIYILNHLRCILIGDPQPIGFCLFPFFQGVELGRLPILKHTHIEPIMPLGSFGHNLQVSLQHLIALGQWCLHLNEVTLVDWHPGLLLAAICLWSCWPTPEML